MSHGLVTGWGRTLAVLLFLSAAGSTARSFAQTASGSVGVSAATPPVAPVVTAPAAAPTTGSVAAPAGATTTAPAVVPAAPPPPTPEPAPLLAPVETGFPTPADAAPVETAPQFSVTSAPATAAAPDVDPLAGNVHFKPGKGVEIKSNDGNFSLTTKLRLQIMDEFHDPAAKGSEDRNYVYLRRVRLTFQGNVFSKDIKYRIELSGAARELSGGPANVLDAMGKKIGTTDTDLLNQAPLTDVFVDFTQLRDLNFHVGQGKVPFGRERMMSDGELQMLDRSIDNDEFNYDRDIGFDFRSQDLGGLGLFRYYAGIYSGEDKNQSLKSIGAGDLGLLYVARFEVLPLGQFEDYAVDLERGKPRLSLGTAFVFHQADAISPYAKRDVTPIGKPGDTALVDYNSYNFTADALFKAYGFSALTAFHYRKITSLPGKNGLGFTIQGGYLFSNVVPVELVADYSLVRAIDNSPISARNDLGFGLNYYIFNDHAVKVNLDYSHLWPQGATADKSNIIDNRVRLQLQVSL